MRKGGEGGGNTVTGLNFEVKTDIAEVFKRISGYTITKRQIPPI